VASDFEYPCIVIAIVFVVVDFAHSSLIGSYDIIKQYTYKYFMVNFGCSNFL